MDGRDPKPNQTTKSYDFNIKEFKRKNYIKIILYKFIYNKWENIKV